MQARKGRASCLGERSIGHKDPGSASGTDDTSPLQIALMHNGQKPIQATNKVYHDKYCFSRVNISLMVWQSASQMLNPAHCQLALPPVSTMKNMRLVLMPLKL